MFEKKAWSPLQDNHQCLTPYLSCCFQTPIPWSFTHIERESFCHKNGYKRQEWFIHELREVHEQKVNTRTILFLAVLYSGNEKNYRWKKPAENTRMVRSWLPLLRHTLPRQIAKQQTKQNKRKKKKALPKNKSKKL